MVDIVSGLLVAVTPTPRPPLRQLEAGKAGVRRGSLARTMALLAPVDRPPRTPWCCPWLFAEGLPPDRFACRDEVPPDACHPEPMRPSQDACCLASSSKADARDSGSQSPWARLSVLNHRGWNIRTGGLERARMALYQCALESSSSRSLSVPIIPSIS
jgi:hypothetical protein